MCNGQAADDCDVMYLTEFETTLNNRLAKLETKFSTINEILETKKEVFIELYRKDPRISHDDTLFRFQKHIESFDPTSQGEVPEIEAVETVETMPIIENKQTIICESFSDDNKNVIVSSCKRSAKSNSYSYAFLNHPKIGENQILKWSLRVPKFNDGYIGMVIIHDSIKEFIRLFDFLKISFQRFWYIHQPTNGNMGQ